jgi:hypothetical protein
MFILIMARIYRCDLNIITAHDLSSALDFLKTHRDKNVESVILEINKETSKQEKTLVEIIKQTPGINIIGLIINPFLYCKNAKHNYHMVVSNWKEAMQNIPRVESL